VVFDRFDVDRADELDALAFADPAVLAGDTRRTGSRNVAQSLAKDAPTSVAARRVPRLGDSLDADACERRVEVILNALPGMLDTALARACAYDAQPQIVRSEASRLSVFATEAGAASGIGCLVLDTCGEIAEPAGRKPEAGSRMREAAGDGAARRTVLGGSPATAAQQFDIVEPEDAPVTDEDVQAVPMPPRERIDREDGPGGLRPPRHYAQLFSELRRRHRQRT
jgi:hypothetical protein